MERFIQDFKHALRMFRQSPVFTLTAVAALALGIGANTAIFSVMNAVLLRPLPYTDPDRLVMLMNVGPDGSGGGSSPTKFNFWRSQSDVLEYVSAYRYGQANLTGVDVPEQVQYGQVSADFFRVFSIPIAQGRGFSAEEDRPSGPHVAVISDELRQRRFGGDPNIVGKTISLSSVTYEVIGVVAPGYRTEANPPAEVWTPFQIDPQSKDQAHYFTTVARLKPGVSFEAGNAKLTLSGEGFRQLYPRALAPKQTFGLRLMREALIGNVRSSLWVLAGAVGFVLLIACANVANLLLVRATTRRREMAIRAAIGAQRSRVIRQLLTESVVLSLMGGVVGLTLGIIGIRALLAINPGGIPRIGTNAAYVVVDWRVVAFTLVVSIATGIIFGLIPALQASRADLSTALKDSGGRSGTGFRHNKTRSVLVVTEMALALILVVGAALLIRTFVALRSVEPGFATHNVLTLRMSLSDPRFQKTDAVTRLTRDAIPRLNAIPGVEIASATCCVPLEGGYGLPFIVVGRPLDGPSHGGGGWVTVSPGYFDVFKIAVVRGRAFTDADQGGAPPVAMINQAMAKQFWPNGDPLADQIIIGRGVGPEFEEGPRQIVGIVGDVHDGGLNRDPRPVMYVPASQITDGVNALNVRLTPIVWVLRTRVPPYSLRAPIQDTLRQLSAGLPVGTVRSMDEVMARSTASADFNTLLLTVFGAAALLLAAIGLYGLVAYSVQQQTQEIGIRLALGAPTRTVQTRVMFQGVILALVGVVVGLAAAFALARVLASLLFGVTARDPIVFAVVPLLLTLVAIVGSWIPARAASRIDPMIALRAE